MYFDGVPIWLLNSVIIKFCSQCPPGIGEPCTESCQCPSALRCASDPISGLRRLCILIQKVKKQRFKNTEGLFHWLEGVYVVVGVGCIHHYQLSFIFNITINLVLLICVLTFNNANKKYRVPAQETARLIAWYPQTWVLEPTVRWVGPKSKKKQILEKLGKWFNLFRITLESVPLVSSVTWLISRLHLKLVLLLPPPQLQLLQPQLLQPPPLPRLCQLLRLRQYLRGL